MLCRILHTSSMLPTLLLQNLVRGIQLIEEQHKMKLVAAEDAGEASLFLGSSGGSRVGTVISPKLSEWIGAEMQKEASIAKERCKAREERSLPKSRQGRERERAMDVIGLAWSTEIFVQDLLAEFMVACLAHDHFIFSSRCQCGGCGI